MNTWKSIALALLVPVSAGSPFAQAAEPPGAEVRTTSDGYHLHAGPAASPELTAAIAKADHDLFAVVFDTCNVDALKAMVTEDFEFFHDKGGYTDHSGAHFVDDIRKLCERQRAGTDFRARRELVEGSLAVYPIDHYGAVETGEHRFWKLTPGKPDELTESGRFLHIWKREGDHWRIARVVSYDHQLAR